VGWTVIWWLWGFPAGILCLADAITTFAYLRMLARRMMNSTLVRISGYLLLGPALSLVLAWPLLVYFLAGEILWLIQYLPWIYYPLSTGLLIWYAILFNRAAGHAERHWAAETLGAAASG